MSSIKSNYPITWMNLEKLNQRIPKNVDKKQESFAKRFRKAKADPFESLAELYRYFDEVAGYMDGLTACKKGCGHCCHMEVALSQLEADFIAAKTGFNAEKALPALAHKSGGWIDAKRPCPFLKDDACSIYEFRPLVCRTYMSFEATSELCRPDNPNPDRKIPQIDRNTSYPGAMKAYMELTHRHGGAVADIRDFFGHTKTVSAPVIFGMVAGKSGA